MQEAIDDHEQEQLSSLRAENARLREVNWLNLSPPRPGVHMRPARFLEIKVILITCEA